MGTADPALEALRSTLGPWTHPTRWNADALRRELPSVDPAVVAQGRAAAAAPVALAKETGVGTPASWSVAAPDGARAYRGFLRAPSMVRAGANSARATAMAASGTGIGAPPGTRSRAAGSRGLPADVRAV